MSRCCWFVLAGAVGIFAPVFAAADEAAWRVLPLVAQGKIAPEWQHTGHGAFAVEDEMLRTDCDPQGLGLLVYTKEKFGNCQIRIQYKPQQSKSNSGVYVRIDNGIIDRLGQKPPALVRDASGQPTNDSLQQLTAAADQGVGPWYAVHHGFEVQICDAGDEWHRTGSIYSLAKAESIPDPAADGWQTMTITLKGEEVGIDVGGKRVTNFKSAAADPPPRRNWYEPQRHPKRPAAGYLGLQNHDPGDVVYFREVAVRALDSANP